jgi:hypothetical protein
MRCMNIRRSQVDICSINNLRRFDIVFCMIPSAHQWCRTLKHYYKLQFHRLALRTICKNSFVKNNHLLYLFENVNTRDIPRLINSFLWLKSFSRNTIYRFRKSLWDACISEGHKLTFHYYKLQFHLLVLRTICKNSFVKNNHLLYLWTKSVFVVLVN